MESEVSELDWTLERDKDLAKWSSEAWKVSDDWEALISERCDEQKRTDNQTLYRLWDVNDRLLYVGITCQPSRRMRTHAGQKDWWRHVTRITIQHFSDRQELVEAETEAIATENPKYNILGLPKRAV